MALVQGGCTVIASMAGDFMVVAVWERRAVACSVMRPSAVPCCWHAECSDVALLALALGKRRARCCHPVFGCAALHVLGFGRVPRQRVCVAFVHCLVAVVASRVRRRPVLCPVAIRLRRAVAAVIVGACALPHLRHAWLSSVPMATPPDVRRAARQHQAANEDHAGRADETHPGLVALSA